MLRTVRRFVHPALILLAIAVVVPAGAQQGGSRQDESLTVDFFAVGPDGSVFDLRADEVTIKIDGKTRRIRSLRYITLTSSDPSGLVEPRPELEPAFGTNAPAPDTRWVTIVLDRDSIRPGSERNAISAALRYINTLGPKDRLSYVTMPNGGVEIDFTTNHGQISDALRKFVAHGASEETEQDRSCRSRLLLNTMADYLTSLAPLQGPKSIVLLSSGVLNPRRDAPLNAPPGPCEIRQVYFQEVSTAASVARAHLYVVQPDDLKMDSPKQAFVDPTASRFAGADLDRAGLESLAGVTGGDFMRIVGPNDPTLTNLASGFGGYYIATIDIVASERNGAMHRVEVAVNRERVRVRTHAEILIPRGQTAAGHASTKEMLRAGVLYRALPIRVSAFGSSDGGEKVKILSVLEPMEPGVKFSEAMFGLIDSRNRLVAQWTANDDELGASPVVTAGEASPGPYRLRVAAIDTNGRRGAAEFEFLARLTEAGSLALSDMALGVSREGSFVPKLVFGNDQAAVGYFEIYGPAPKSDSVTVRMDLANGPDDRALTTAVARVVTQGDNRRIAIGAFPIASFPPGEYVVRATVSVDGRPVGRITRTLRKSPSGS
jgi:VWFA-related protein